MTSDNQTGNSELAYGQIWKPTVTDNTPNSRVVESVACFGQVAFTLRSFSGLALTGQREVVPCEEWNRWVETYKAKMSGMIYPCLKRIILHELGHLVVDFVLTGYLGVLSINQINNGYDARVELTDVDKNARKSKNDIDDLVSYCASAYGGWAAVEFGINEQVDNSLVTTGDIMPGFEGFTGADSEIISVVKRKYKDALPKDFERVVFEKAKTVITAHFNVIWEVTQRLEKEVNTWFLANSNAPFQYSQDDAYSDFASLKS